MEFGLYVIITLFLTIASVAVTWIVANRQTANLENELSSLKAKNDADTLANGRLNSRVSDLVQELDQSRVSLTSQKEQSASLGQAKISLEGRVADAKAKSESDEQEKRNLREELSKSNANKVELETAQRERDESHAREVKQFEKQKVELLKEFENLANKVLDEKSKSFSETNTSSINNLLKPFREQIEGFQKRINEVHDESVKGNTALDAEIKKVLEVGLKMGDEASNLTSALKGDSQLRGAWGEAQLERTLEMSGLIEDTHFEKQSPFKDEDGKQKYTDYIIKLPDDKHIIIDSKVSLIAYDKVISATTAEEEALAMDQHAKAVKSKIDDLVSKDYTNLIGMRSPSFVLMFIPIEPAYIELLKNNRDLFDYGYAKGIVLVSHTTLIPILRTVANLWMLERSNTEAREISEKAGDIYNQVCLVAERLQKMGQTLGTVSRHYNSTVKSLVGQQGLHGKVERFKTVSNKVTKAFPQIEPTHIDFEIEKLELIAEPINEEEAQSETMENGESMLVKQPAEPDE